MRLTQQFSIAMVIGMTAAEKLRAWRERAELSQAAAAARVGLSQAAWSDYEAGLKRPQVEQAIRLSELTEGSAHHVTVRDWRESDESRMARARARKAKTRRANAKSSAVAPTKKSGTGTDG